MTKTGASLVMAHGRRWTCWERRRLGRHGPLVHAGDGPYTSHVRSGGGGRASTGAIQAAHSVAANPRSPLHGGGPGDVDGVLTPLGHPVNMLVMGQGGYRFKDYGRVGGLLTVLLTLSDFFFASDLAAALTFYTKPLRRA